MNYFELMSSLEYGLVFSIMSIGVFLSFRVLDFPDLTVDSSFPLGAAVAISLIYCDVNPFLATIAACFFGFLAGILTGTIAMKMKILNLLASIIVMTGLYSVNLHILKSPNLSLLDQLTVFDLIRNFFDIQSDIVGNILVYSMALITVIFAHDIFFRTNLGLTVKACGNNPIFARSIGINTDKTIIFGMGASNALVAFSGALYAQSQMMADVSMGMGTIISGLAAVIIGESLFKSRSIVSKIIFVSLGSIFYRVFINFAINLSSTSNVFSLSTKDLNLLTSLVVLLFLGFTKLKIKSSAAY